MIIPGILEDTFEKVEQKVRLIEDFSPTIQIDVTDDTLIQGKTFLEIEKLGSLRSPSDITIHFMVENPINFINKSNDKNTVNTGRINGVSTIITQLLNREDLEEFIKFSKDLGYKVGLSINTDQDNSLLYHYIKDIDLVQFMSVIPGRQGNEFIPTVLNKIRNFKSLYPTMKTQVDGGINEATLPLVLETGVDNEVIGSAILSSENPKEKYFEFLSKVDEVKLGK